MDDDFHFVLGVDIDQRPTATIELDQSLLDQGRQFESSTDLVYNRFFFELFEHSSLTLLVLTLLVLM